MHIFAALSICCLFLPQSLFAQDENIPPFSTPFIPDNRVIIPFSSTYRLPAFTDGTIFYRNGMQLSAKLNYNLARDEMHFINEAGDTLIVADPPTVSSIVINHNRFYYYKEHYLQLIRQNEVLALAFRQEIIVHLYGHAAPYASNNVFLKKNTVSLQDSSSINGRRFQTAEGRAAMMFTTDFYYLGDGYGNFTKATRFDFLQYYKKDKAVADFIRQHHTDFNKLADLIDLMNYCDGIR